MTLPTLDVTLLTIYETRVVIITRHIQIATILSKEIVEDPDRTQRIGPQALEHEGAGIKVYVFWREQGQATFVRRIRLR